MTVVKEAEYKSCGECGSKSLVSDEIHGCDTCKTEIDFNDKDVEYLRLIVFQQEDNSEYFHFCSWKCVFEFLPRIKSNYFVDLPYLSYDSKDDKLSAKAFFEAVRNFK